MTFIDDVPITSRIRVGMCLFLALSLVLVECSFAKEKKMKARKINKYTFERYGPACPLPLG
jgi:hypothetical protein